MFKSTRQLQTYSSARFNQFWLDSETNPHQARNRTVLNLVLLGLVVMSALIVVRFQYQSRTLVATIEKTEKLATHLASLQAQALAQQRHLGANSRVEQIAIQELKMHSIAPSVTVYLSKP